MSKRALGSDLRAVDAHLIQPAEYDEIPELDDAWFESATPHKGGKPLPRGRPKSASPKQQVTLRLDRDILDHFRDMGAGWQSRINEALKKAVGG